MTKAINTWTYETSVTDTEFLQHFIEFLQSCLTQRGNEVAMRPQWVPSQVRIPKAIRSELPFNNGVVEAGVYGCQHNQWGAISVFDSNGELLGVRPHECVVEKMCRNDHLDTTTE